MKKFNNILFIGLAITIALASSFSPAFAQRGGNGKGNSNSNSNSNVGSGFTANGGFWNNANDWSGGQVPSSTDDVFIFVNMTVDQNAEAQNIEFQNGRKVTINPGDTLTIYGDFNGTSGGTQMPNFDVQGTLIIKGDINATHQSGGDFNFTGDGNISVEGDVNTGKKASISYDGNGSFTVNGEVTGNGSLTVNGRTYGHSSALTVANGEVYTILNDDVFTDIIIENGGTLNAPANGTFTVSGNFTNNGTYNNNNANVTFNGAGITIGGTAVTAFDTVNFNNSTTLNATVEVTTEANVNGTLDTDLTHATAELVMKSNANQTAGFYNNGTLNGNIVMERYISGGKYGHYITAPVQMPINEFAPAQAAYRFNASLGRWATVNTANNFAEGLGYNIILKEETVLRYKGKPNGNTVSLTLNKSNRNTGGFNLVGNPFPFPIVWKGSDALAGNGVAYVYDADKTSYEEIAPFEDFVIEPGQAFFVKAAANQATLTFAENETSIKSTTADMSTRSFFRVMNVEPDFLKLTVNKENTDYSDKVMFLFDDNAKAGYDYNEDADNRAGWGNSPEFYSVADGKKLALNALPRITEEDTVTIPLFVNIKQAGNYSLNMDQHSLNKLPADLNINLYDSVADVSYDLRDKPVVSFTENNSQVTERFVLTLTKGVKVEEVIVEDTVAEDSVTAENIVTVDSVEVGVADTASADSVEVTTENEITEASTDSTEVTVDATETESIAIDTTTTAVVVADTVAADSVNENNEEMVADTTAVTQDTVAVGDTVAVENTDSVAVDSVSVEVADTVAANSTTESELVDNTSAADTVTAEVVSADSTNGAANRGNDNKEVNEAVTGEPSQKLVDNTAFQQISATDLRLHGSNREIKIWLPETLQTAATFIVYGLNGQVYNSLNLAAGAPVEQVLSVPANGIYVVNMTFNGQTIQKRVMVR